jgi:hypothetical protein
MDPAPGMQTFRTFNYLRGDHRLPEARAGVGTHSLRSREIDPIVGFSGFS